MLLAESTVRLATAGPVGFAWAIPAGTAAGVAVARGGVRLGRSRPGGAGFIAGASTAGAAFQVLLGGAPVVVWAVGGTPEDVSAVFLLFLFSKAPLTLLFAVQALVLSSLALGDQQTSTALGKLTGRPALAGLAVTAGAGGGLVLPFAVRAVAGVDVPSGVAGLVAAGVTVCAVVQLLGQRPASDGKPLIVARSWLWALTVGSAAGGMFGMFGVLWAVSAGFAAGCVIATGWTVSTWAKNPDLPSPPSG